MTRRTSLIEDLMEISARLPWKFGVGAAVVTYLALHYAATRPMLAMNPADVRAIGDSAVRGLWITIANVMQYIIPGALLVGAGVSFVRQRRKDKGEVKSSEDPSCPKCGAFMVRRTARTGSNAGNSFWGCSQFPQCRGVRD